ncbi:MAG: OsmC family protein [Bryobacteraceae bacterium]
MNVKITYEEKVRFRAEARGHQIVCDQPVSNKGEDAGMTPPEFLLVSLGTCAGYYAVEYLKTRSLPTEGLEVNVEAVKATGPARLGEFHITVHTPELEQRHRDGVLRAVKACLVHNTLAHPPQIAIEIDSPVAA